MDAQENKFYFDLQGSYRVNDYLRLSLDVLSILSKRTDITETNRNYINIMPRLKYHTDQFDVSVGLNVIEDNDSGRE